MMDEEFVSESITPVAGTMDTSTMAQGMPGLPRRFCWRGEEYEVDRVVSTWKESGRDRGSREMYLRKHWFQIITTSGDEMKLFCERQARSAAQAKKRWWLFTVRRGGASDS